MDKPEITVIVAGQGRPPALEATLRSLAAASELPLQALALAWAPADASVAASLGAAFVELPASVGASAARNQVVGVVDTPWLAFLSAGVRVERGWDRLAVERLRADPGLGAVGGRLADPHGNVWNAGFHGASVKADERPFEARYQGEPFQGPSLRPRPYQSLSEHFLVLSRGAFQSAGGFDAALSADYAGHDLCFKLRFKLGKALAYEPACVAGWAEGSCPEPGGTVRIAEHRAFFQRWKGRLFADFAIWDAVDASEAKTGRAIQDYERLL